MQIPEGTLHCGVWGWEVLRAGEYLGLCPAWAEAPGTAGAAQGSVGARRGGCIAVLLLWGKILGRWEVKVALRHRSGHFCVSNESFTLRLNNEANKGCQTKAESHGGCCFQWTLIAGARPLIWWMNPQHLFNSSMESAAGERKQRGWALSQRQGAEAGLPEHTLWGLHQEAKDSCTAPTQTPLHLSALRAGAEGWLAAYCVCSTCPQLPASLPEPFSSFFSP